ncbi:efflux RND transporter periplasmic adaptor subunit [Gracilibacillus boraciitolerans]|uniref:efflux RND transporter periplasmic adaptor subunit n=1 Tax=Gracilibacillus boraciitolerans TaxID=307521 RepID=UPI001F17009C|nr:biotin/lipoyl-binding protein [Gracilibacillus boraciitolerans]
MVVTFLLSLTACSLLPKEEQVLAPPLVEPATVEYDVAEVQSGAIIKRLTGTANFIPVSSENLFYQQSGGRLDMIHVSESDSVKKGDTLIEIDSGNIKDDIQQLEIDFQKADLRVQQLVEQKSDKYSIEIAKLDKQGLGLRLSQLREQLAASKIVAPMDGIVTFVTDRKIGETVEAFESIVRVADTTKLQLLYSAINTGVLDEIVVGMTVNVSMEGKQMQGGEVVQTPEDIPEDVAATDSDLYDSSILIRVDLESTEIEVGQNAEIEVVIAKKEDTLLIPKNGLRTSGARNYVQILVDNTKREVDIETGIISTTQVEVLKGLDEGDKVILK